MSYNVTANDINRLNKTKKRKINMDQWADVKRKKLRDAGKTYISKLKKEIIFVVGAQFFTM